MEVKHIVSKNRNSFWLKKWLPLLIVFILWAIVVGTQKYYYIRLHNDPVTFRQAVGAQILNWTLWALLCPIVFWMAHQFSLGERFRNWLIHIPSSIIVSLIHLTAYGLLYCSVVDCENMAWAKKESISTAHFIFKHFIMAMIHWDLILYWMLVAVTLAYNYFHRYREEALRASQLQYQLAQAQLEALKMQLNPHFLFNTLHAISSLLHKDVEIADRMIARLGDFLRLTLENGGDQEITLEEELNFLKCYLDIELIRFQDRLSVETEIEPTTLDAMVPNLILQPIVENAIKHGIAPRSVAGRIKISASRDNGNLRLEVKDNGSGLKLNKALDRNRQSCGGVGLANTQERLFNLYGEAYKFDLSNAQEGGLIVTLEFPFKQNGKRKLKS
jgi:two-component system, LytTR family, sensor kinase